MKSRTVEFLPKQKVVVPAVHLNGSGYDNLSAQYGAILEALNGLATAIRNAAPHMRDYYVYEDADDAFKRARSEYSDRRDTVSALTDEVSAILEDLADQRNARGRRAAS